MRPLFPDDQAHPGWPSGQLGDAGDLHDPPNMAATPVLSAFAAGTGRPVVRKREIEYEITTSVTPSGVRVDRTTSAASLMSCASSLDGMPCWSPPDCWAEFCTESSGEISEREQQVCRFGVPDVRVCSLGSPYAAATVSPARIDVHDAGVELFVVVCLVCSAESH